MPAVKTGSLDWKMKEALPTFVYHYGFYGQGKCIVVLVDLETHKLIISLEASRDLDDILDYFLTRDIETGERFLREFNKKCQYLTRFPNIGRSYSNFDPTLRGIPLNSYIIFYRLFEDRLFLGNFPFAQHQNITAKFLLQLLKQVKALMLGWMKY
jgi:toxin ParE1/3/4